MGQIIKALFEKYKRMNWTNEYAENGIINFADFKHILKLAAAGHPKKCPRCGSLAVIMFTADLDLCRECNHQF